MAFESQIESIKRIRAEILRTRDARVLKVAHDLSALIKMRIQTKGESASGGRFPGYVPAYLRERKAAGYQVSFVDFTRTGRLWAGVSPRLLRSEGSVTTVVIESRDERGKEILKGAEPKRGNLLAASKEEIQFANAAYSRGLASLIKF